MRVSIGLLILLGGLLVSAAPVEARWKNQTVTETFLNTTFSSVKGCDDIATTVLGFTTITTEGKGTPASSGASADILIDWDNTCKKRKVLNTSAHVELPDASAVMVGPDLSTMRVRAQLRVFRPGANPRDPGSWHDVRINLVVKTVHKVRSRNERHNDPVTHVRTHVIGYDANGTASGSVLLDGAGVLFSGWRELADTPAAAQVSQLILVTYTHN
jgi:hypothetical protein